MKFLRRGSQFPTEGGASSSSSPSSLRIGPVPFSRRLFHPFDWGAFVDTQNNLDCWAREKEETEAWVKLRQAIETIEVWVTKVLAR